MYKNKKILAFIPARKGSKRLKNKNKLMICNIPLFEHSINIAKKSKYIDDIIVSTDSPEILARAHELGCIHNTLRSKKYAGDNAKTIDTILYELEKLQNKYDVLVLLQPTSPYRTIDLLDTAIKKYFESETSLVTVIKVKDNPILYRKIIDGNLKKILKESSDIRSQDYKDYYKVVGSIYINNIKYLTNKTVLNENVIPFIMNEEYDNDIDTYEDYIKVKKIMEEK